MPTQKKKKRFMSFTAQILVAMFLGIIFGYFLRHLPDQTFVHTYITDAVLDTGGKIFIAILKMLVVPIVFVSLVCGTCQMHDSKKMGVIALKTFFLYILTTALAITIAITLASLFNIGSGASLSTSAHFNPGVAPTLKDTIINIIPSNPIDAMAKGNMLQIIVFALLFGVAISNSGRSGRYISAFFGHANTVLMKLIGIVLSFAPIGVFCLLAKVFASEGIGLVEELAGYFFIVLLALLVQWALVYPIFIKLLAKLNPIIFMRKLFAAMIFAFSTSSSSASIPVVLETVENKLGVRNSIASFIIPLGATINMDGTAIMQGVATVFIAHLYGIEIGLSGYLTVIFMATLASIGTASVPSVGLITLTMVLQQVGLPVEGITLILGIDRILDMTRTAVNISGDCMVATVVAKSQKELNVDTYNRTLVDDLRVTRAQVRAWHE